MISVPALFRPKRQAWFSGFVGVTVLSVLVYVAWSAWIPWRPGRAGGVTFGTIATVLFCIDGLYPFRRRLVAWPLRTVQDWLQFHVYGGVFALLCVTIHMGFALPVGQFGWWLFALSVWATLSGLMGVCLQKYVPTLLANNLSVEAIYERIPTLTSKLQGEADQLVLGAPDLLKRVYLTTTRKWLGTLEPSWSYVLDFRAERERRLVAFGDVIPFLSEPDRIRLVELQAIVTEKLELDVQYSLQRILKAWVPFHAVPSIVLIGLMTAHIVAALLF